MTLRKKFNQALIPDKPNLDYENKLWEQGLVLVAGVDEAGRGALAGPVAAGAVVFNTNLIDIQNQLSGVRDSKALAAKEREEWAKIIKNIALAWGVGFVTPHEIDQCGIVQATHLAAKRALEQLGITPQHLLVDYLCLSVADIPQTTLIKGDARALSIASAAILAKTSRDAVMVGLDNAFPEYGFAQNKGYGTRSHRAAIEALGPCCHHRRTFSPISNFDGLFPPTCEI